MQINEQKPKNGSKTIYETFDGTWRKILRDPYTGWTITLAFAAAVGVSLLAIGYFAYAGVVGRLSAPVKDPADTGVVLDDDDLRATLEAMNARADEHAALSKGYSGPGDPSI